MESTYNQIIEDLSCNDCEYTFKLGDNHYVQITCYENCRFANEVILNDQTDSILERSFNREVVIHHEQFDLNDESDLARRDYLQGTYNRDRRDIHMEDRYIMDLDNSQYKRLCEILYNMNDVTGIDREDIYYSESYED